MKRLEKLIDGFAGLAMIGIAVFLATTAWRDSGPPVVLPVAGISLPVTPVPMNDAVMKGSRDAEVVMIEYADFECPYCATFAHDVLPSLLSDYVDNGQVRFAFRHVVLEQIHTYALGAAVAAECAGVQGRFWEMHDSIFDNQSRLDTAGLHGRAKELQLDLRAFSECTAHPETAERVRQQTKDAYGLGIKGTPTVVLGRLQPDGSAILLHAFQGVGRDAEIRAALDALLSTQR